MINKWKKYNQKLFEAEPDQRMHLVHLILVNKFQWSFEQITYMFTEKYFKIPYAKISHIVSASVLELEPIRAEYRI